MHAAVAPLRLLLLVVVFAAMLVLFVDVKIQ
jgi:hypothetical protein